MSALERIRRTPSWRIDAVLATCFVLVGLTTTKQSDPVYEPRDAHGGSLNVGPASEGGFRVDATIPYDRDPQP